LLTRLLRQVSRSFYLTLRVLPGAIRPQIGLAYLLARATDTIADTELVSPEQRLDALRALREAILNDDEGAGLRERLGDFARQQGLPAERELLERLGEALALLSELSADDRQRVRDVLATITSGQQLDLERFGRASEKEIVALVSGADLDDYTYRVAGCVGEFWTKMCRAHLFPRAAVDDPRLLADGVRFGKGLQLVNILRDLPRDLRQGRCYLPSDELAGAGLAPDDLLDARQEPRLRPVYDRWLDTAHAHLAAGWDYTNSLPGGCTRVRLACAWPVLIGVKTLGRLRLENVLDANQRIKITRAEVRGVMIQSLVRLPFRGSWRRLFVEAEPGKE
jgi:farnesyl-diphosphate farnesyltransferase